MSHAVEDAASSTDPLPKDLCALQSVCKQTLSQPTTTTCSSYRMDDGLFEF